MSRNVAEETELSSFTVVYDNEDRVIPSHRRIRTRRRRNMNGEITHTDPQNVNENQGNDGTVEVDEILVPDENGRYTAAMPVPSQPETQAPIRRRYSSTDETDYEKGYVKDYEDVEEPYFSYNPYKTEESNEESQSSLPIDPLPCWLTRSSYLQTKSDSLFHAVTYHLKEDMDKILNEEPSTLVYLLTKRDEDGRPCIMKAISRQSLNCIRPLLDLVQKLDFVKLSNMNQMDALESQDKKNILHVAAQMVLDQEIINSLNSYTLIDQLVDRKDLDGATPLLVACRRQNHLMAEMLVKKNAKIDTVDKNGYSPIYWAAVTGSAETLKLFLDAGKRVTTNCNQLELFKKRELYKNEGTILQAIVESRCPETLQVCLDVRDGKDHIIACLEKELENHDDKTFIHAICQTPLVSLVELTITNVPVQVLERPGEDGVTPLMTATETRQLDIVRLILSTDSGKKTLSMQKESTGETTLMIACKLGFYNIVEFIMGNPDTNINLDQTDKNGQNVFHHAAQHDQVLSVMIDICNRTEKYKKYQNYLNVKDEGGYVPLHHAASRGSYKNVRLLLDQGVPYDTPRSLLNRTALHFAACSNIKCVKTLLDHVRTKFKDRLKEFVDAEDSRLQTSLHIAASLMKWQTVSVLLEHGATLKCDIENETPLHLASYMGCTKTVQLLIESNPTVVNHENRVGETAAIYAAINGQTEMLEMLLQNNAELWANSLDNSVHKKMTCLDWAVVNKKEDTAKAIIELGNWKKTMEMSHYGPDGLMAMMVKSMPNVAIDVLNKCEKKINFECEYDFFALQTSETPEGEGNGNGAKYVTAMKALETMAKYSRNECLSHDVVQQFLDHKWKYRARKWYLCCLFIYTMFLLSFAVYISLETEGYGSHKLSIIPFVLCCVFAVLSVVKELFQLFHRKLQYFCLVSTYLELIMYLCVFTFLPYNNKSNMQRQAGAIAIFLGWINFTWFLKRFPTYGIYIIMAKKIFVTFLKVFIPVSFFAMAFSMAFFVLLHKRDEGFENFPRSFVTTFAMMAGEVDYRDSFLQQTGKNFVLILSFLVLFLVLMSILLMNLLTGLAVGDIGVIMRRSLAEKKKQRAMLIVNMDKYLTKYPGLKATYVDPITIRKKGDNCAMSCLQTLMDKMFPRLHIEADKENNQAHECEMTTMMEQLNSIQKTVEEIKQSLQRSPVSSTKKNKVNRGYPRNATL